MWWLLYRVTKEKDPCWRENQMTFKCLDRNGEDLGKGLRAFVFWFFPSQLFQVSNNTSYIDHNLWTQNCKNAKKILNLFDNKEILPPQAYINQISRTCSKYMKFSQPSTRGIAKWNLRTTGTAKASGTVCNSLARKRWNWFWLIRLIGHCPSPWKHFPDLRIRFQGIFPALPRSEEERAALKREFRRTGSIPTTVPEWRKDKKCGK